MTYNVRIELKTEVNADSKTHARELAQHDLLEELTSMDHWLLDELADDVEAKKVRTFTIRGGVTGTQQ